jgi:hypothetical protein
MDSILINKILFLIVGLIFAAGIPLGLLLLAIKFSDKQEKNKD